MIHRIVVQSISMALICAPPSVVVWIERKLKKKGYLIFIKREYEVYNEKKE